MKDILEGIYASVCSDLKKSCLDNAEISQSVNKVCRCVGCKAPIRFLISGLLAKIKNIDVDLRKPYSTMGEHSFAGRSIDEDTIQPFVHKYNLPCNPTTAYLTPAFRTITSPITKSFFNKCRPKYVYEEMMYVIDYVESNPTEAQFVLSEMIRILIVIKNENKGRMDQLIQSLKNNEDSSELSSEEITDLLIQHLKCNGSSRLPVLIIAAAYKAVEDLIDERYNPLYSHNAADSQTGALGDIEIVVNNEENVVTCYEMKKKKVTTDDIDVCVGKILEAGKTIDNYIIITTDVIDNGVKEYAKSIYDNFGFELVVLDCLGFINHYLHFFHRRRTKFLNYYQDLLLAEPDSAVSQPLKEAFLTLRRVAENKENT